MPELPDIEAYLEALRPRVVGERLLSVRLTNPFLLRTVDPPLDAVRGGRVKGVSRLGSASCSRSPPACSDTPYFLVIHLMIAGRLHWGRPPRMRLARPAGRAAKRAGRAGERPGRLRVLLRHAVPHRSREEAAGVPPSRPWPGGPRRPRPRGMDIFFFLAGAVRRGACGARTGRSSALSPTRGC